MGSGKRVYGGHVHSAYVLVQSNDYSPRCLDESVDHFLAGFREVSGRAIRTKGLDPVQWSISIRLAVRAVLP